MKTGDLDLLEKELLIYARKLSINDQKKLIAQTRALVDFDENSNR